MAEVTQSDSSRNTVGKIRAKKRSTKIDMTPMVDLAFLLLTFFILTTTFTNKVILRVDMPDKTGKSPGPRIDDDKVLNLVLAEDNKVYWWIGFESPPQATNYSKDGIRKILLEKTGSIPGLMVLIKPKDNSKFENIVDVLDEISITKTQKFAIVDFSDEDKTKLSGNK